MLGKNRCKKCEKTFFKFTRLSWPKNGGKMRKQFYQKHTNDSNKMLRKIRRKNVRKNVFYIHTNNVTKQWWEKNSRNNFSSKNVGKNIVAKKWEKTFFIFTRISWPKNGEKKSAKQFFQKRTNGSGKNVGKTIAQKERKNVFYIHTNIVTKK